MRELRLQSVHHRPRRLALGFKVYRLGKIGEDGGQFLLGQAEPAARRGERFGAVGREAIEVIFDCGAIAAAKRAARQPQLVRGR